MAARKKTAAALSTDATAIDLTAERLRELLDYDPETGAFTWRVNRYRVRAGDAAGGPHNAGYLNIRVDGRLYLCHRLAWFHFYGRWPADQLDHIDSDRKANRITNLRECSNAENCQNVLPHRDGTSKFIGVCWDAKIQKWIAQLTVSGKRRLYKTFDTETDAAASYAEAKRLLHSFNAGA